MSAGAFGTPQILMASGLGPGEHLQQLGITPVLDVPGVGQNLQDHISALVIYRSLVTDDTVGISAPGIAQLLKGIWEWRRHRSGLVTSCAAESGAYYRTSPDVEVSDMEMELIVGIGDDHGRKHHLGHGYSAHLMLSRPKSVGEVRLASPDTRVDPLIDPRFFSHPYDMETLVTGTQIALDIMSDSAFDRYRGEMIVRYDRHDRAQIEETLRDHADTEYHVCGTCQDGPRRRPNGGRRPSASGSGPRRPAHRRCLGDAPHHQQQHPRPGDHDRREVRRPHPSGRLSRHWARPSPRQDSRRRAYVRGWARASARTSSRSPDSGYDV